MWIEINLKGTVRWKTVSVSPSAWGCGLKWECCLCCPVYFKVTLCVRVWIEIKWLRRIKMAKYSHPLREGVDWNVDVVNPWCFHSCHPLREGVDWNWACTYCYRPSWWSPSAWGCGLKSYRVRTSRCCAWVTLCVRVWIEIFLQDEKGCISYRHPPREGVDWNHAMSLGVLSVFARARLANGYT